MKLLRLAPENTKFGFMRFRRISYPFSAVLSILSVVLFLAVGMNYGIDFAAARSSRCAPTRARQTSPNCASRRRR